MGLKSTNEGEIYLTNRMLHGGSNEDWTLRLYSNNKTPAASDTIASYTECTLTGYSAATLDTESFTNAASVSGVGSSNYSEITFGPFTSAGVVYGYYITSPTSKVLWAERLLAARTIAGTSETIPITIKIGIDS